MYNPEVSKRESSPKSWEMVLFLLVFTGLHRFYLGRYLSGVLYLFTVGGFTMWTMCDFVRLMAGTMYDSAGRPVRLPHRDEWMRSTAAKLSLVVLALGMLVWGVYLTSPDDAGTPQRHNGRPAYGTPQPWVQPFDYTIQDDSERTMADG